MSGATATVASANLLNLALPGRRTYENQPPYDDAEAARKTEWLGQMIQRLNADVLGVQEVWDEAALKAAVAASGLRYPTVLVPGAESGATGTPRVGLVTRWMVLERESIADFHPADRVEVPDIGPHVRFERPVLQARLKAPDGRALTVLVAHLKSKRPKLREDADGRTIEDASDPLVLARGTLRSLLMRAGEAAALRRLVVDVTARTREPLVLLGDLNDGPHAVTTQMISAHHVASYDKALRDTALYHALWVQTDPPVPQQHVYSHVHQGQPDLLDQIWVSEEFVAGSKHAIGDICRVDVFNDHLHESRERWRSDHGFVRALLRFAPTAG